MTSDQAGAGVRQRWWPLASALVLAASLLASCDPCANVIIDVTIPAPADVFQGADALVEARIVDASRLTEYRVEVELEVESVLVQSTDPEVGRVSVGSLEVVAYDTPCGGRSGLRLAGDDPVLVVLAWRGFMPEPSESPWTADPILEENGDGIVRFLDTRDQLNQRIDMILDDATREGLIEVVEAQR